MKNLIIFLLGFTTFSAFSQKVQHTIGIIPIGITKNRGLSFVHGLNYKIDFYKNTIFVGTEGVFFRKLDAKKREAEFEKYVPFLNQSKLEYGREIVSQIKEHKTNKFQVTLGYHFLQHGAGTSLEYWNIDSLDNDGVRVLSGFLTHSVSVGINWSLKRYREIEKINLKSKNTFELNYFYGLNMKLRGYDKYPTYEVRTDIANTNTFIRHGLRFAYKYEHFLSNRISLYAQLDLFYGPFINYKANPKMYLLRGSENIEPSFSTLKIGVNIFI